jgi:abortive infection bacteriophage resistance protein
MSDDQKQTCCKPALSLDAQIDLLISRGLEIPDRDKACHYLRYIGYYRLSGYYLTFQQKTPEANHHTFKKGVTFGDILDIYIMDRELRLLVMDAIERIEVASFVDSRAGIRACTSLTYADSASTWVIRFRVFSRRASSRESQ